MSGPVAIWAALQNTALEPFRPASAYGAPALGGALIVCALYYARRRQARGRRISVRAFVRSIFPRRILLHPSSLVDMSLWALNGVVFASAYGMLGFGLFFWRDAVVAALTHGFGPHAPAHWPAWTVLTLATVLQVLAYELAYWFAHYCFHKVPALWEFHKVHHSAEVMTALTELRQHPVEIIAFMNLIGLSTGIVFGAMTYAFGPGVRPFTLLNGNILTMAFLISYGHLRHSHMWIAFTGVAGRILQSPGPPPAAPFRQSGPFRQEPRLCARPLGLGVRHARNSGQVARTRRIRRRRRGASVPLRARRLGHALRALRRPCGPGRPNDRAPPGRRPRLARSDDDRPSGAPPIE